MNPKLRYIITNQKCQAEIYTDPSLRAGITLAASLPVSHERPVIPNAAQRRKEPLSPADSFLIKFMKVLL
jgi:hypothetical protein